MVLMCVQIALFQTDHSVTWRHETCTTGARVTSAKSAPRVQIQDKIQYNVIFFKINPHLTLVTLFTLVALVTLVFFIVDSFYDRKSYFTLLPDYDNANPAPEPKGKQYDVTFTEAGSLGLELDWLS